MRHLTSIRDLTADQLLGLIKTFEDPLYSLAAEQSFWEQKSQAAVGKILISLFVQPSTRTRTSFNASFLRMGGNCIHFSSIEETLAGGGESIEETGRFLSQYGDLIVVRAPQDDMPIALARHSEIPVVSAGHGKQEHPTAAINHLHTVFLHTGRLEGLTVLVAAKHPKRCINSFLKGLSMFPRNSIAVIDCDGSEALDGLEKEVEGTMKIRRFSSPQAVFDAMSPTSFDVLVFDEGEEDYRANNDPVYLFDENEELRFRHDALLLHFKPLLRAFSEKVSSVQRPVLASQSRKSGLMRAHILDWLIKHSQHVQ